MTKLTAVGVLLLAAVLEAGGDAVVRLGLKHQGGMRWQLFPVGALMLFVYGCVVNVPNWDFGRLLGLYIVFFFAVAQLMSWLIFHQPPSRTTLAGGFLILAGGFVLSAGS
jgi:small multidrug resistance family-3 protein